MAAITSNIRRRLFGDYLIADWKGDLISLPVDGDRDLANNQAGDDRPEDRLPSEIRP